MSEMLRTVLALLISGYRNFLSPMLPRACRFYPSCSAYTEEAIRRFGILKGISRGLRRISRCNPRHPGGYDPVR